MGELCRRPPDTAGAPAATLRVKFWPGPFEKGRSAASPAAATHTASPRSAKNRRVLILPGAAPCAALVYSLGLLDPRAYPLEVNLGVTLRASATAALASDWGALATGTVLKLVVSDDAPNQSLFLSLKKMAECGQRLKTVADDLSNRQHGHRKDPARNTPHPEPEDERDDDEDGIEGEPPSQKHRR